MIAPEKFNDTVRLLHDNDMSVWTYSFVDGYGKSQESAFYTINGFGIRGNAVVDSDFNRTGESFSYGVRNLHKYVNDKYGYGNACRNIEAHVITHTR